MLEFWAGIAGFSITAITIRLLNPLARPLHLLDVPGPRKHHAAPVPLTGGLAILVAFLATAALFTLVRPLHFPEWPPYLLCISLLAVVGIADDAGAAIGPGVRTFLQMGIATVAALTAHVILIRLGDLWGDGPVTTGSFAIPFTVLSILGVTNSMNLIDGSDGLAGLVSLAALFWIGLFAEATGQVDIRAAVLILGGGLVAFLAHNLEYPKRRIRVFLGSTGTTFLGFTLAWMLIHLSQSPKVALPPIVAVWIMGLPILDTVSVMLRRILRGRNPLHGGRDHLHHLLAQLGLGSRSIAFLEATLALGFGSVGYLGWAFRTPVPLLTLGFVVLALVYFTGFVLLDRKLGWAEWPERMLFGKRELEDENE